MRGVKDKQMNIRHGHGPRRGCNAVEKAIETRQRQFSREEIRAALWDLPELQEVYDPETSSARRRD